MIGSTERLRTQVRAALATANISQAEAARQLGVSTKHLSMMLTGRSALTLDWADRLLGLCGMALLIVIDRGDNAKAERHTVDTITSDALDALYERMAELEAERDRDAAISAQIDAKTEEQINDATQVVQYYKTLSERTQLWGEQHRDRANRYRARTEAVRDELAALNSETAGLNPYAMAGRRDAVARIRAVLQAVTHDTPVPDDPRLAALAPMFEGLARLMATSSRDWGEYRVDAWLWAVLLGWDCEQDVHDETCVHGTMEEMQEIHGWDDAAVAKARRYRAAVRAVTDRAAEEAAGQCSADSL